MESISIIQMDLSVGDKSHYKIGHTMNLYLVLYIYSIQIFSVMLSSNCSFIYLYTHDRSSYQHETFDSFIRIIFGFFMLQRQQNLNHRFLL